MEADKRVKHKNPHLEEMKDDVLYHIGLNTKQELKQMFGDVKVILSMKKLRENTNRYLVFLSELSLFAWEALLIVWKRLQDPL